MKLAVLLVWVLVAVPTLTLPWSTCDDPNTFTIAARIDEAPALMRPLVANRAGAESYPGRFMPLFWVWLWGTWKVLGPKVLAHRLLHVCAFLVLGFWVYRSVERTGASPPRAALAAIGFLIFPAHYELWPELQPAEPWQAICAAAFVEALATGRGGLAAAALLLSLGFKETSLCLGLPLLAASVFGERRFAAAWVVFVGWLALFAWARPSSGSGAWVANYQPTPATCLATLTAIGALLWKSCAVLPAAAALAVRAGGERADRLRVALAAAWAVGGVIVFLPWSQLGPRHYLWFSAPLAVVLGAGCARAGRIAGALAALSLVWMSAQFAVTSSMVLARRACLDGSFWAALEDLAPLVRPGTRLVDGNTGTAGQMAAYLRAVHGLDVTEAPLAQVRAGDLVVAATRTPPALVRPDLALAGTSENRMTERDLPEPRYALSLARRALAGERGPDGTLGGLLVPRLFERQIHYAVMVPR